MSNAESSSRNLALAREKAAKMSQDIRRVSSLLSAAESLRRNINPRAANGLQELFDVVEVVRSMTGRLGRDSAELDNIILLLCAQARGAEPVSID
jgi:hypothetical protein